MLWTKPDKLKQHVELIDLEMCRWAYENLENNDPLLFARIQDGVAAGLTPLEIKMAARRRMPEEGRKIDQVYNAAFYERHLQRGE